MLTNKSFLRWAGIIFLIGAAIGVYQGFVNATFSRLPVFISDLMFTECMAFLVFGVIRLLGDMHAFTSASYGFRFIHKLFRNEEKHYGNAQEAKDDYLKYREERPRHGDGKWFLLTSLIFLLLSLLMLAFM